MGSLHSHFTAKPKKASLPLIQLEQKEKTPETHNRPRLLYQVVNAIVGLKDVGGSTITQISSYICSQVASVNKWQVLQIRRALNYAVSHGLLMLVNGKYKIGDVLLQAIEEEANLKHGVIKQEWANLDIFEKCKGCGAINDKRKFHERLERLRKYGKKLNTSTPTFTSYEPSPIDQSPTVSEVMAAAVLPPSDNEAIANMEIGTVNNYNPTPPGSYVTCAITPKNSKLIHNPRSVLSNTRRSGAIGALPIESRCVTYKRRNPTRCRRPTKFYHDEYPGDTPQNARTQTFKSKKKTKKPLKPSTRRPRR